MTHKKSERYDSLNGLRTYAAIGIVWMHVYENTNFNVTILRKTALLSLFNNLTFLFMMISAFSMCCGYFETICERKISIEEFYSKRYKRILPFFCGMVVLDCIVNPSINSLFEGFADITLIFGFLPNADISVIGVGWFLGVIFIFYMIFPWFCYLLMDKFRTIIALLVSMIFNVLCTYYFFDENHVIKGFYARNNFLWCSMFFVVGGIVYKKRTQIIEFFEHWKIVFIMLMLTMTLLYIFVPKLTNSYTMPYYLLLLFSLYLIYAISNSGGILDNKIVAYISDISMQIYLSHMLIFRVIEKSGFIGISNSGFFYIMVVCTVVVCTIAFVLMINYFEKKLATIRAIRK